jgi:hypothetical protein
MLTRLVNVAVVLQVAYLAKDMVESRLLSQSCCSHHFWSNFATNFFARASATVLTRWGFGSCCQLILQLVGLVQLAWPCFDGFTGGATSCRDRKFSNFCRSGQKCAALAIVDSRVDWVLNPWSKCAVVALIVWACLVEKANVTTKTVWVFKLISTMARQFLGPPTIR